MLALWTLFSSSIFGTSSVSVFLHHPQISSSWSELWLLICDSETETKTAFMQILHKQQSELKSFFFSPSKACPFVSYFNAIVNKLHVKKKRTKREKVPCGGHPLAPSGHDRSCKLDDECLVREERRGSVQGCWQTEHTVNQPDCPLVVVTLKRRSRWLLLLFDISFYLDHISRRLH